MVLALILIFCSLSSALAGSNIPEFCTDSKCKIENNCRCASVSGPYDHTDIVQPQLIAITFSEEITQYRYDIYWKPLLFDKKNRDGSPISGTFYVPHENTDYGLVNDLYVRGFEIGDYSITKRADVTYWDRASFQDLVEEFGGQRTIISTFASIPIGDIKGVRTPFYRLNGDLSINAYQSCNLTYDNSWETTMALLPYTLDFASVQECLKIAKCPVESHPNFWIVPIVNLTGISLQGMSAEQIANWLLLYVTYPDPNPAILLLDSNWFRDEENSVEGFKLFLDMILSSDDYSYMFFVSVQDILDWLKSPIPLDGYKVPDHSGRKTNCFNLICPLRNEDGEMRYMKSCVPCPDVYPWKGNPLGKA